VVDDVMTGVTEASRPEVGRVAIAGHDQEFGAFGRGDHLGLGAPDPFDPFTSTGYPRGGQIE
jgi:hypothetical protein